MISFLYMKLTIVGGNMLVLQLNCGVISSTSIEEQCCRIKKDWHKLLLQKRRYSEFFWSVIFLFGLNKEIYRVNLHPTGIYLLKVNNRNTKTRCEIRSKLTINTPERLHWPRSDVFIVNFEYVSHINFEHVITGWVIALDFSFSFYETL